MNDYIGAKRNKAEGIITRLQVNGMLDELSVTDLKKIIENNGVRPVQEDSKKETSLVRSFTVWNPSTNEAQASHTKPQ